MPRAVLHQIGDAELCHDKHGLAELSIAPDQPSKILSPIRALQSVHDIDPQTPGFLRRAYRCPPDKKPALLMIGHHLAANVATVPGDRRVAVR